MDNLAKCLEYTISPNNDIRKPAEKYLLEIERNPGFGEGIFYIIMNNYSVEIKVASAIAFKNFVKRKWKVDESNDDNITQHDRQVIKSNIVELMLNNETMIQSQLSEAVSVIGKYDFPDNWTTLLPQLISKIEEGNFIIINGVLRTCHSLFKRYRFESRCNKLWLEIKEVVTRLGGPLAQLLEQTMILIDRHINDKNALDILWNSVLLIEKIFLSLNHQDLPEYFEDSMSQWMDHFHKILLVNNPLPSSNDSNEVGIMEQVKSHICHIISLYARNYDEEFVKYIPVFIEDILKVILNATSEPKYDLLVANALHFISLVADRTHHRELFVQKIDLQQLSQKIIIPNIEFQESDQELFIENSDEYIRRDIEGSHSETRRKSACELVKALCRSFEQQVVNNFVVYIQELLSKYAENPNTNWKMKDSALFLITSVASKGETGRHGITATTEFVNINDFYKSHVLPELKGLMSANPVIQADCIKYLMTFRSIIPAPELREAINLLIPFTMSPHTVVHSYAAAAINKLLMVRETGTTGPATIQTRDIANPTSLITGLCGALGISGSEENPYVIQAIMRSLSTLQAASMDCQSQLVEFLHKKVALVVKNPQKPVFNHALLETIALCVRIVCTANSSFIMALESVLCPTLTAVLVEDNEDFVPYAFQLFSLMLDQHPTGEVGQAYQELFPLLVHPALWERLGNVPSLIRLLLSYLERASWTIIADQFDALVAIFLRLNNSRALDSFGFALIGALLTYAPRQHTERYLRQVFEAIFRRLSQNKTAKYLRGFLGFLSSILVVFPPVDLVDIIDKLQPNLFGMVIESALLPTIEKVETVQGALVDAKLSVVGLTRLVLEAPQMSSPNGIYGRFVPGLITRLVGLCVKLGESARKTQTEAEAHFIDIEASSASTSHNQLVFVGKKIVDPATHVTDPVQYFADSFARLSTAEPARFKAIYGGLDDQVATLLKQLLNAIGINM